MASSDIVIKNQFTNQKSAGSGSIHKFVMNYMLRPDAVEPLVLDEAAQQRYLARLTQLRWPQSSNALSYLNQRLQYDGVGFDLDNVALSRQAQEAAAARAQSAYDRGGTVRQMVISFDGNFLQEHGLLSNRVQLPANRGDLRGQVDMRRLRTCVMDGMKSLINQTTMHDPAMVASVQTDTSKVHVHLCLWDDDPKVKDDRGMINTTQRLAFVNGFNQSMARTPQFVNEAHGLENVAEGVQRNADFKIRVLEHQLYESALRLDQPSLNEYIANLVLFDQRTLSRKQRENVKAKIVRDFVKQGRRVERSHTLSHGQRRARRQIRAEQKATRLRHAMREFDSYAINGTVDPQAWDAKAAMNYEYVHQQHIVEKYRMFQRPRVDAIYQVRARALNNRRENLLRQRQQLLKSLSAGRINPRFLKSLTSRVGVMQALHQDQDALHDFNQALDDPAYPLSQHTVHVVSNAAQQERGDGDEVMAQLMRNQTLKQNLSNLQRQRLFQYLHRLTEYEMDAASFGGLATDTMSLDYKDAQIMPTPDVTSSIYNRPKLGRENSVLLASDVNEVLDAGPLKPGVEMALRQDLQERGQRLYKAHQYFKSTNQNDPQWLTQGMHDVNAQFAVLRRSGRADAQLELPKFDEETTNQGYDISQESQREMVHEHLKTVDGLER